MPVITDSAICIRRWDFSETSQTVSLLTREHGVIRGLAKGAKRPRGAFSGGFDLLTSGQVVVHVRRGRELATLAAWHLDEVFRALHEDLAANRAGLYMADLVHRMLTDHDPHPDIHDALLASLRAIDGPGPVDAALLQFQWRLLEGTGYRPVLDRDAATGASLEDGGPVLAWSPRAGGTVHEPNRSDDVRVRGTTIHLLRSVAAGDACADADVATLARANRLLAVHLRALLGDEPIAMRWALGALTSPAPAVP